MKHNSKDYLHANMIETVTTQSYYALKLYSKSEIVTQPIIRVGVRRIL